MPHGYLIPRQIIVSLALISSEEILSIILQKDGDTDMGQIYSLYMCQMVFAPRSLEPFILVSDFREPVVTS